MGFFVFNYNISMEKQYMIRCLKCRWGRTSTGTSEDLKDLYELKNHCSTCGKKRQFRCPKCGKPATMTRVAT
jgi:hypothetical protein